MYSRCTVFRRAPGSLPVPDFIFDGLRARSCGRRALKRKEFAKTKPLLIVRGIIFSIAESPLRLWHGHTNSDKPGRTKRAGSGSVYAAIEELLRDIGRDGLTIPLIAEKAGVTPSTIYRRWGTLPELLADVAIRRFDVDDEPLDTGTARTDLEAWTEQFAEEMASGPGQAMIRDVLAAQPDTSKASICTDHSRKQLRILAERAEARGEVFPAIEEIVGHILSPIVYRILFDQPLREARWRDLVARLFDHSPGVVSVSSENTSLVRSRK